MSAPNLTDRMAYIIALRDAGHTLDDIGSSLSISRERVRQLLEREGRTGGRGVVSRGPDPIALLRFARSPECRSLSDCSRRFGASHKVINDTLHGLGVHVALLRLYRWRTSAAARRRVVDALQSFVARHGRAPTSKELNRGEAAAAVSIVHAFGSVRAGFLAAGLEARPVGAPGHLRDRAGEAA